MEESKKWSRGEIREFWEEAIELWAESGLSVRAFCNREGLAEHTFYSWRRKLMPERPAREVNDASSAVEDEAPTDGRRRRRPRPVANPGSVSTSAIEFLPVRVVGDEGSRVPAACTEAAAGAARIEIVGPAPWRVRLLAGFAPTTLAAVLTVLERRPC